MRVSVENHPSTGPARIQLRPQDLPAQTLTAGDGVIVADAGSTADWGLAKRGSGVAVKPVETARELRLAPDDTETASELVLEPAYINVKLCVREGVELPPELAGLAAEGAK